jgi:hypothetical protein
MKEGEYPPALAGTPGFQVGLGPGECLGWLYVSRKGIRRQISKSVNLWVSRITDLQTTTYITHCNPSTCEIH